MRRFSLHSRTVGGLARPFALVVVIWAGPGWAQSIGTDLTGLLLCFYGDCEARGAYAADPLGWTNPGTLPVVLKDVPRGIAGSGTYYRVHAGDVAADLGAGIVTAAYEPFMFQAAVIYGDGSGSPRHLGGVNMRFKLRTIALGAAADLGKLSRMVPGLSLGAIVALPITEHDLDLASGGVPLVTANEHRGTDVTVGAHWRGGDEEWLMLGAFVNGIRNELEQQTLDLGTGTVLESEATNNAWFARAGLSIAPAVPLEVAKHSGLVGEWLGSARLAADVAYANLTVPGEGNDQRTVGYFGIDVPLIPERWNLLARWLRPTAIVGIDTDAGWGTDVGLQGMDALAWLSCNPAYSSRPLAKSLAKRVDIWAATCTATVPL